MCTPTHWHTVLQRSSESLKPILQRHCARTSMYYTCIRIGCKYPTAYFACSCWQTQGLSEMIHNYPGVSLMLAFLTLYSILFFIPNLITLQSLQGAAQDSYLPIRQIHLCYFDFNCSAFSIGVCVCMCVIKTNTTRMSWRIFLRWYQWSCCYKSFLSWALLWNMLF